MSHPDNMQNPHSAGADVAPARPTQMPGAPGVAGQPPIYGVPAYGQAAYYGAPYSATTDDSGIMGTLDILRLLRVLRRKWVTVLLVLLFFACATAFYLHVATKVYRAGSLLEMSVRRPRIGGQQGAVIEDPSAGYQSEEVFNTRLEKMKSKSMVDAAIARFKVTHPGNPTPEQLQMVIDAFEKTVNITLLRRTRLIRIETEHPDPRLAADICNTFAETAVAGAYDENRVSSDSAVEWLQNQAAAKRKELDKADEQLMKFRQDNKTDALESQRKTVEDSLLSFNKALVDVESQESKARDLVNALGTAELKPEEAGKLPAETPRAVEITDAIDKWMDAKAKRDDLLSRYTAKHPEVEAKEKIVSMYRAQVSDVLNRAQQTAASNLKLLSDQAASLQKKKAEQSATASELEFKIVECKTRQSALERERDACEVSYKGILNRIEEARLAADENTATIKLVERAAVPEEPVKPRVLLVIVAGLALGLLCSVGLALIVDTMEDHIEGPHDIETAVGLNVLAIIPHIPTRERKDIAKAALSQKLGQLAEVFAGLRSSLDSVQYKNHSKVLLISSSVPAEGKTITTCNLAITCAKNGQKVLLIDFDMRRPRIMNIFPIPAGNNGLLQMLTTPASGHHDFKGLVYPSECANLDVIGTRVVPNVSPAELIGGRTVVELIQWARQNYDRVILDAPPLGLVSDATVLAGLADGVLVVSRPYVSRKRSVAYTVRRFRDMGIGMIAAVVNDVKFSKHGHYDSTHYGYHSYQAYGATGGKAD